MSREKQIEEIVKDFCPLYQEYGSCKRCNKDLDIDEEPYYYGCVANLIIDYGYRKSTEVAEEIFGEIEHTARAAIILLKFEKEEKLRNTKTECYEDLLGYIAELKKKYTEDK